VFRPPVVICVNYTIANRV